MKLAYHALLLLLVIHGVVASHSSRPSESLLLYSAYRIGVMAQNQGHGKTKFSCVSRLAGGVCSYAEFLTDLYGDIGNSRVRSMDLDGSYKDKSAKDIIRSMVDNGFYAKPARMEYVMEESGGNFWKGYKQAAKDVGYLRNLPAGTITDPDFDRYAKYAVESAEFACEERIADEAEGVHRDLKERIERETNVEVPEDTDRETKLGRKYTAINWDQLTDRLNGSEFPPWRSDRKLDQVNRIRSEYENSGENNHKDQVKSATENKNFALGKKCFK